MQNEAELNRELERVQKENFNLKMRIFSLEQELAPERASGRDAAFASEISTEIEKRDQLLLKARHTIQSLSSDNETLRHRLQSVENLLSETEAQAFEWKQRVAAFDAENHLKGRQAESAQSNFRAACQQIEEQKQKLKQQHYLIIQLQRKLDPSQVAPPAEVEDDALLEDIGIQWKRYVSGLETRHTEALEVLKREHQQQLERFLASKNGEAEAIQREFGQLQETIFGLRNHNEDLHRTLEDLKIQAEQHQQTAEHFKKEALERASQIQQLRAALIEAEDVKTRAQSLQNANSSLSDQLAELTARAEQLIRDSTEKASELSKLQTLYVAAEARAKQADALERSLEQQNGRVVEQSRDNARLTETVNAMLLDVQHLKLLADQLPEKEETVRAQAATIADLKAQLSDGGRELAALRDRVSDYAAKDAALTSLGKKLERREAELQELQAENAELPTLREAYERATHESKRLRADGARLEAEVQDLRAELEQTRATAIGQQEEATAASRQLSTLKEKNRGLEERLRARDAQIQDLDTTLAASERAARQATEQVTELTSELAVAKAVAAELKAQAAELEAQNDNLTADLEVANTRLESRSKDIEFAISEKNSSEKALAEYRESLKRQEAEFETLITEKNDRITALTKELDASSLALRASCKAVEDMAVRLRVSRLSGVKTSNDIVALTSAVVRKFEGALAELDDINTRFTDAQLRSDQTRGELGRLRKELDYCGTEIASRDQKIRGYLGEVDALNKTIEGLRQEVIVAEKNLKEALDQRSKLKTYNTEYKDKIARQDLRITSLQERIRSQEVMVAERVKEIEQSMQRQVKTFLDAMTDHISRRVTPEIALSEIKRFELIFFDPEEALRAAQRPALPVEGDLAGNDFLGSSNIRTSRVYH
ncbi:Coiled-coil protein [Giardia muris]|uniref:Coiled-coil protein n=1 Tax=Giardia muris TaxID=5742 RepID=A0A4Z1SXG8_GIAMU|nr:Coiled-coil protein [Giardia muris]|eukprot:TNJ26393.1 Coiled-coil protein [Giardia muris]